MIDYLLQYGYVLIVLGVIFEGDATLAAAGYLAHEGYFSLSGVIVAAAVASTVANEIYYRIARTRARGWFENKVQTDRRYAKVHRMVCSRSGVLLVFSRSLYGLRMAIPAVCGMVGMKPLRFFLYNLLGGFIWAIPIVLAGHALGEVLKYTVGKIDRKEWVIFGIVAAVLVLLYRHRCDIQDAFRSTQHPVEVLEQSVDEFASEADFTEEEEPVSRAS